MDLKQAVFQYGWWPFILLVKIDFEAFILWAETEVKSIYFTNG
jgi:hypothetical protein